MRRIAKDLSDTGGYDSGPRTQALQADVENGLGWLEDALREELDRRRGTILRLLESQEGVNEKTLDEIRGCMDRFELEDLFVPHRRAEPEVQLALDRGLGGLADR